MGLLDSYAKQREQKEKDKDLLICPNCKKEMKDNSFKHGSRKAGTYNCDCGYQIMF